MILRELVAYAVIALLRGTGFLFELVSVGAYSVADHIEKLWAEHAEHAGRPAEAQQPVARLYGPDVDPEGRVEWYARAGARSG